MKILITGATGFIGAHLTSALIRAGHEVTACIRHPDLAQQRWPGIRAIKTDFSRDHSLEDWLPRLQEIDVVINAVGIIRENRSQNFDALHAKAPCALFRACEQAGIKRVIQISALGADETAFSQYHLSKRTADRCLMALNLSWIILLPSIVYGSGAKSMALFKAIAATPVIPLMDNGNQAVQPIHTNDLVKATLQLVHNDKQDRVSIPMVGPSPITMKEIYSRLRRWLGLGKARYLSLSYGITLLAARLGGFLGNTPITAETVQMLRRGNTGDVRTFEKIFGFTPVSFDAALDETPAQQSDRWHAGLYFLKPLLRYSIAFLWIFTGIASAFVFPAQQSYAMLAEAGITGAWAPVMLYGAAATDIALGVATLMAYRLSVIGSIQIGVIVLYTVIISVSLPGQWVHPFGPISKNLPLIVATYIMMVLERR